jgi:uncharacterized SAM-binding protein YcdF (DUF218 family)
VFFFLSKLLDVFLSPYTWAVLLLLYTIPWRRPQTRGGRRWRMKRAAGLAGLGLLILFAIPRVSNALLYRLEHAVGSTYSPDVTYDAVILLGGITDESVQAETGQPAYNDNVERLVMTHRLLATGKARYAIISGAAMDPSLERFGEARVLAGQIEAWGIDPSRLILEERARNTHENAVYSQRIVAERTFGKVLIVTSAFHMRRAAECFEAVGLPVDTLVVDYRASSQGGALLPRAQHLAESAMVLREMAGLYVYRLRGYAKERSHE